MLIEGPLKIGVLKHQDRPGYELHIDFADDFKSLDLRNQGEVFNDYLRGFRKKIPELGEADRNRAGMLIVQQIAEQFLPHIERGEMALEETVIIEIGPDAAEFSLADLAS